MNVLTESEKERCRYHLGYLETSLAGSVQLGMPRPLQTIFLLESALTLLENPFAIDRCRKILATLDMIEEQLSNSVCTLVADKLGDLSLHPLKDKGMLVTDSIEREYVRWAKRLADLLGVSIYPFADRFRKAGPGSAIPVR